MGHEKWHENMQGIWGMDGQGVQLTGIHRVTVACIDWVYRFAKSWLMFIRLGYTNEEMGLCSII
jgi:hypothetical protein